MVYFMDWHPAEVIYHRLSIDSAAEQESTFKILSASVSEFWPYSSIPTLSLKNRIRILNSRASKMEIN